MAPTFSPPTVVELQTTVDRRDRTYTRLGNRLQRFYAPRGPVGRSVLRTGGVWATVQTPTQAQIDTADTILDANGQQMKAAFLGGHVYQVSTTIGNELTAAGYAVTP